MRAVVTTGAGGTDRLELREVPVPMPGSGEVLVRVLAAGVNNTDVNTRLGWYSPGFDGVTDRGTDLGDRGTGWSGSTPFPLIQGTDCCGVVEDAGPGVDRSIVGRRVIVRPCMRVRGFADMETRWMGSDFDGAFAEYVVVPAPETFAVRSDLTDAELGAIPCAYGTAENMLQRSGVRAGDHVLVTGASGGVGSATVQLAKLRGATVTAICSASKAGAVLALGADATLDRDADLGQLGRSVDVTVDNVAGDMVGAVLATLRRGGRYVSSGAVAGPLVSLDMRTLYLNDLTLIGCTAWDEPVFPSIIGHIEAGRIRPVIAGTFPLEAIADAQRTLLERRHVGKLVLLPARR